MIVFDVMLVRKVLHSFMFSAHILAKHLDGKEEKSSRLICLNHKRRHVTHILLLNRDLHLSLL